MILFLCESLTIVFPYNAYPFWLTEGNQWVTKIYFLLSQFLSLEFFLAMETTSDKIGLYLLQMDFNFSPVHDKRTR